MAAYSNYLGPTFKECSANLERNRAVGGIDPIIVGEVLATTQRLEMGAGFLLACAASQLATEVDAAAPAPLRIAEREGACSDERPDAAII